MLVLSRRENERIILGDDIVITIVRINDDQIRIGIEAPRNIVIMREELQQTNEKLVKPDMQVPIRKAA